MTRTVLLYLALAAASVAMLIYALPGYEVSWLPGYEQSWLSFAALVPILVMLRGRSGRTAVLVAWLAGFAFFLFGVYWVRHLTFVGWLAMAAGYSPPMLLFALALGALGREGRWRVPFVLAVPVLWVGMEHLRMLPLGGFAWHFLGHNFYRHVRFIQIADVAGVPGISFVVAAVNAALAEAVIVWTRKAERSRAGLRRVLAGLVFAGALVALTLGYGAWRVSSSAFTEGPRVSVVQGNIPQDIKEYALKITWEDVLEKRAFMRERYLAWTRTLAGDDDMVVWPETVASPLSGEVIVQDDGKHVDYSAPERARMHALRRALNRPLLVGAITYSHGADKLRIYNSAYYFKDTDAPPEVYHKIYPVPFGEYVPFQDWAWFQRFVARCMPEGYEADLTPGSEIRIFTLKGHRFATDICYEDTKPSLNRELRARGAEFVVNLTNDGWFEASTELDQHLANAVFRSVENRFAQVRATNTGVSAFIDPNGEVTSFIRDEETGKHRLVAGVLTDTLWLDERRTLYTTLGDAFAWLMLATSVTLVTARLWLRRRRRRAAS